MIHHIFGLLSLFVRPALSKTSAQLCRGTATLANDGNWYCSEVQAITYKNISQPGKYNRTTRVNPDNGLCEHEPVAYSGVSELTPLIGELSMHLRGPMNVSKIAVRHDIRPIYSGDAQVASYSTLPVQIDRINQPNKDDHAPVFQERRYYSSIHNIDRIYLQRPPSGSALATSQRQEDDTPRNFTSSCESSLQKKLSSIIVPATSILTYVSEEPMTIQALHTKRDEKTHIATATSSATTSFPQRPHYKVNMAAAGEWSRVAHYTSTAPAAATGFAFLANLGDPRKSGTFDYSFGNSLGYVIGDGSKVASQSTPFSGSLQTSEREIAIFTDKICDGDCEYARPDSTAHYGWSGPSKAFFIEFQMDHYDNYGTDQGMLSDAPAWWFLNAAIPRILQYGNDRNNIPCSCWSTGCGEFDAFEILGRGEVRAKSTIHRQGNLEGGDSNYFLRPVGRMVKFAVVFHNWNITARVLDDGFVFGEQLVQEQVQDVLRYDARDASHSLFAIGD